MKYLRLVLVSPFLIAGMMQMGFAEDEPVLQLKKKSSATESPSSVKKQETPSKLILEEESEQPSKPISEKKKSTSDLDRQLLEELTGKKKVNEPKDKQRLIQLIKQLEQAEEQISKKKTGKSTQQLQQNVVDDLDWLIQLVEQQQTIIKIQRKNQKKSSSPQKPNPANSKKNPSNSNQPPDKKGRNKKDPSGDSEDSLRKGISKKPAVVGKRMLEKDVWGHLPPTLRKKLLNIYSEKYLPQYDDVVRQYFESLAEESRKSSREE